RPAVDRRRASPPETGMSRGLTRLSLHGVMLNTVNMPSEAALNKRVATQESPMNGIRFLGACVVAGGLAVLGGCVAVPAGPYYGGGVAYSQPYYAYPYYYPYASPYYWGWPAVSIGVSGFYGGGSYHHGPYG